MSSFPHLTSNSDSDNSSDASHDGRKSSMGIRQENSLAQPKEGSTGKSELLQIAGNSLFYQDKLNEAIQVYKRSIVASIM